MRTRFVLVVSFLLALGLVFGACKGPIGPAGPAGPAGPTGSTGPTGPTGATGNANVTLYIFDGHDFATATSVTRRITVPRATAEKAMWLIYLVWGTSTSPLYYIVPGPGYTNYSEYRSYHQLAANEAIFQIRKAAGPGETYFEIRIFRVDANNIEDKKTPTSQSLDFKALIPEWLDIRDYHAVARHFGLE